MCRSRDQNVQMLDVMLGHLSADFFFTTAARMYTRGPAAERASRIPQASRKRKQCTRKLLWAREQHSRAQWADAPLSRSYCDYTSLLALTATKAPLRPAEVLGSPLAPQGTPSPRTAEETKGNGRFRAVLVARCRHM